MTGRRPVLVLVAMLLIASACNVKLGGTLERRRIPVDGVPTPAALKIAQDYATPQQLTALRQSAKAKFPKLSETDLNSLTLRWQQMAMQSGQQVMIEVTFTSNQSGVNAEAVADYVGQRVLSDIQALLAGSGA
jgi:hypothetical protein